MLLVNGQSRYGGDHHDHFNEVAVLVQDAQGVQGFGNIVLPWQPDRSELIIHRVRILRGSTEIDLLAGGREFTVLRRENNLESAMLDGTLTAMMQAEGLAVGDVLDVAFTLRQRGGTLPLRGEGNVLIAPESQVRRLFARHIWPATSALRWRGTGVLSRPAVQTGPQGTELTVDLADVTGAQPPQGAPPRYSLPTLLQLTEYRDWSEISAILAPHYERAGISAPGSPLQAEIARIAAASSDPRVRAMMALRLVQDQVRYFALLIGDGNLLPASADETWTRRYGDCKGKTTLLLALLHGLGVEAGPVLVNVMAGDALREALPQMSAFNHVIVRARIGGVSYWLDGTRTGDRDLEQLRSSRLGWGLPLRDRGVALEELPFQGARPNAELTITYDGSRGLLGEVPFTGEMLFGGEMAATLRALLSQRGEDGFREVERQMVGRVADDESLSISHAYDDAQGSFALRFSGLRRMSWTGSTGSRTLIFQFQTGAGDWQPGFTRPEGQDRDAPYWLGDVVANTYTETVILPDGGRGFTLQGGDYDRAVAGVQLTRSLSLVEGRATSRTILRPLQLEISAREARGAAAVLADIANRTARVSGPATALSRQDRRELRDAQPETAAQFVERGFGRLQLGELEAARLDFERARSMSPQWSRPVANLAIVAAYRGDLVGAERLAAQAEALSAGDFVVWQARGMIALQEGRAIQAVTALTRSLTLEADNNFTLFRRSEAYLQLGAFEDALGDLASILRREPANRNALRQQARIHVFRNRPAEAIAAAEALLALDPADPVLQHVRAEILTRLGHRDEAATAFRAALAALDARAAAAQPSEAEELAGLRVRILADDGQTGAAVRLLDVELQRRPDDARMLNERCWTRAIANVELPAALADCDRSLAVAPRIPATLDSRAFVRFRQGQFDAAIADANAALAIEPRFAPALYVRGLARIGRGDREAGQADLAAARRIAFDIDLIYRAYGVAPPAVP